jgi:uncharacterized protein (TIGR00369 family)
MTDIPTKPAITAEQFNEFGRSFFPGHMGIEITAVDSHGLTCRMPVKPEFLAPNGFLHAGAVVTMADTACGYGTVAQLPEGASGFTTIELKSNFTGTAREGMLTCRAQPLHTGRLTQVWEATVTDAQTEKTIAHFRCTQMILFPGMNGCLPSNQAGGTP